MRNTVSLSVITLTKNRAQLLEKCLTSLDGQLFDTDEVIIIDNNSTDNTQSVIRKHKQTLPVQTYKTTVSGYPNLYNLAISKCTKTILVFLDDDCEATKNFIVRIRERYDKKMDFVLQGKTLSLPRNNMFAEISEDHLFNWIDSNTVEGNRLSVIDNRNVAIPKVILQKVGGFSPSMEAGSEDVELGMRLVYGGVPIIYDPWVLAYHHERTRLGAFLSQHARIAKSHAILDGGVTKTQKISIVNKRTWKRHTKSFWAREIRYWQEKRYRDMFYLPLIYILLGVVRILGYLRAPG